MKVNGQLERANLEQVVGNPVGSQPTGRVVADITTAGAALPKFYNGTTWKQLAFSDASGGLVTQNSGKSCTVNWASGLNQQVVLTDNAVISFSNPQTNQVHRLIVTQNSTMSSQGNGPAYAYVFNMTDQDCGSQPYQPLPLGLAKSRNHVWFYKSASRPAITTVATKTFGAGGIPANAHLGSNFSADGTKFGMSSGTSPFHDYVQIWDVDVQKQTPIGQLNFLTPTTVAGASTGLKYTPDGRAVYLSSGTAPFLHGYSNNSTSSGIGTVFTAPATAPAGACKGIDIHPMGTYVIVGHATTPFMSCYPLNAANALGNIGTILANPATLPGDQVNGIAFAPTGDFVAAGIQTTSPFFKTWPFTESYGSGVATGAFGAVVANPSSLPASGPSSGLGKSVAWRPQADYIAMAMTSSPYLFVVPFNRSTSTYGTPLSVAASTINAQLNSVQWTPDGQYLICCGNTGGTATVYIFDFSAGTIGAPVTWDVGAAPTTPQANDICIHPSGIYMILVYNAAGWIATYQLPQKQRNYVRLA